MRIYRSHSLSQLVIVVSLIIFGSVGCEDDDEGAYRECDLAAPDCDDGTTCRRSGNDGTAYCVPSCSDDSDCREGYVCHDFGDGDAACVEPCDPAELDSCGEGLVCELYNDGTTLCTEPVVLSGDVFDLTDLTAIEGAHVVAADDTGAAASDVAITAADGSYELTVSSSRDAAGNPDGIFTLRVSAQDYLPYPYGIRPAIPVDASDAVAGEERFIVDSTPTQVGLIPLAEEETGRTSISGTILSDDASGTLVVAEGNGAPAPFGFADSNGAYTIFNVPEGSYEVRGYQQWLQLEPVAVTVAGEHLTGVDISPIGEATSTVSGQVNIVNAPGGSVTSVVLIPESTFDDLFTRGEVPPGLRAPEPWIEPNITGGFTIDGVPDGDYVVLAAFENDDLVRDPDPSIAGTQIVHISVPTTDGNNDVNLSESFKITEALEVISPGADGPEAVSGNPTFIWTDDSSETGYAITLYDAFGVLVWEDQNLPRVTGDEQVRVPYDGPSLEVGMFYQWRVTSYRDSGPISTTEDLKGVFFLQAE